MNICRFLGCTPHLTITVKFDHDFESKLDEIVDQQDAILTLMERIMATLDETLVAVTEEDTKIDSIIVFLDGIEAQLAEALANTTLPADVQAKVDAIFEKATAGAAKIATAMEANVPVA